jgi:hypothetical protein
VRLDVAPRAVDPQRNGASARDGSRFRRLYFERRDDSAVGATADSSEPAERFDAHRRDHELVRRRLHAVVVRVRILSAHAIGRRPVDVDRRIGSR